MTANIYIYVHINIMYTQSIIRYFSIQAQLITSQNVRLEMKKKFEKLANDVSFVLFDVIIKPVSLI